MSGEINILGIAGSLRADSFNRSLLRAAKALARDKARIEIFDLAPIPLYNGDVETRAHEKFDAEGNLIDGKTAEFLAGYLVAFREWILRFA